MESVNNVDVKLFNYSLRGDFEGVVDALAQGGRVAMRNPQGGTPLIAAAQNGHTDVCILLLAHGSNVNEMEPETKDTVLHNAAGGGHESLVEVLLAWGANIDAQDHTGMTPLHAACQEGHLACVITLLKTGARVSSPCNQGSLPIHAAAEQNRVEIVRTLLDHGCNPDRVRCRDSTLTTMIFSSFLLSAGQLDRENTTHVCSIWGSR